MVIGVPEEIMDTYVEETSQIEGDVEGTFHGTSLWSYSSDSLLLAFKFSTQKNRATQ